MTKSTRNVSDGTGILGLSAVVVCAMAQFRALIEIGDADRCANEMLCWQSVFLWLLCARLVDI